MDGRVIPVIPRKRRAQFVLAARLCAIAEGLSADRFLRGGAGKILQISGEQLARGGPPSIDLLSKLRERSDRAKVGLNNALSSGLPKTRNPRMTTATTAPVAAIAVQTFLFIGFLHA